MAINVTSERILAKAVELLTEWESGGMTLDACLDDLRANHDFVEKGAVASLLFEYFRHKGFIDTLIARHAKKEEVKQELRLILACTMTQVFFQTGLAMQSAVNIAVDYTKYIRGQGCGSFINAMLRSMLRDQSFDHTKIPKSFPEILSKRWKDAFGAETASRLTKDLYASNPPLSFRLRKEISAEELEAIGARSIDSGLDFITDFHFYETEDPSAIFASKYLENATIYIQDPATSMPFSLLSEPPSGKILDACAAPGGKTIMIHDMAKDSARLNITASDRSSQRLLQMNQNLRRAGVRSRSVTADAQSLPFSPETFDFILADLPCSNTGVIRRRPDAPWRFSMKRLTEVVALQKDILNALAKLLRPGGTLLYSTCSIEAEEDTIQIENFLSENPNFSLVKQRLLLPTEKHDGAFAAVLNKNV